MNETGSTIVGSQDPSATSGTEPLLYSRLAIDWFSILMTPLFGCIMLAMNLKRLSRSAGMIPVLSFGLAFSIFIFLAIEFVSAMPVFIWNGIGTVYLHHRLWNRYMGNLESVKKRSIRKPLIIALLICAIFLSEWIYSGTF